MASLKSTRRGSGAGMHMWAQLCHLWLAGRPLSAFTHLPLASQCHASPPLRSTPMRSAAAVWQAGPQRDHGSSSGMGGRLCAGRWVPERSSRPAKQGERRGARPRQYGRQNGRVCRQAWQRRRRCWGGAQGQQQAASVQAAEVNTHNGAPSAYPLCLTRSSSIAGLSLAVRPSART